MRKLLIIWIAISFVIVILFGTDLDIKAYFNQLVEKLPSWDFFPKTMKEIRDLGNSVTEELTNAREIMMDGSFLEKIGVALAVPLTLILDGLVLIIDIIVVLPIRFAWWFLQCLFAIFSFDETKILGGVL